MHLGLITILVPEMSMGLQRYRAVKRKLRSKPEAERNAELVHIIKAGDDANRAAHESLRNSGLNQEVAEIILSARHLRRLSVIHPTWAEIIQWFRSAALDFPSIGH